MMKGEQIMNSDKNHITSKQLIIFVISGQLGLDIIYFPNLVSTVGHDIWLVVLLSGIISTLFSFIISGFLKRYSDKSIYEINKLLYGKYLGCIFNFIFTSYLLFSSILAIRLINNAAKTVFLSYTPSLAFTFFFLIPSVYLVYYGLKPICRFANIIILIIISLYLYFFILHNYYRLTFIMPVGCSGLPNILNACLSASFLYFTPELVLIIYPFIIDKTNTSKSLFISNIISTVMVTSIALVITMYFGENMLKILPLPLVSLSRAFSGPITERVDLLFMGIWFPSMTLSLNDYFFSCYLVLGNIFKIKSKFIFLVILTILCTLLSRLPRNFDATLDLTNILTLLGIIVFCFIPISYIFSFVNKRGIA